MGTPCFKLEETKMTDTPADRNCEANPAGATIDIQALVSGALTGAMPQLQSNFEKLSGRRLSVTLGPSTGFSKDAIPVRLENGERPDVLVMTSATLDKAVASELFLPLSRVEFVRTLVGVATRPGLPAPDISTLEKLKETLLAAQSIGYSEGASGVYVSTKLLQLLGIAEIVAPKMKKIIGELVGEALVRGEIELCLQQISELKAVPGITNIAPLPKAVESATILSAAVSINARNRGAAVEFVNFLTSTKAAEFLSKSGLEPILVL